jgi:hypothetical protein
MTGLGGASERLSGLARRERFALAAITALFLVMAIVSWRRSGDILVDWGRELYTAWRLAEGDTLYIDVASLFGPLSQYYNAFIFRLFGASAANLLLSNLVLIAVAAVLVYALFRRLAGSATATAVSIVFLSIFAFAHRGVRGTYNYLTPYAHEATHGVILGIVLIWALERYARLRRPVWMGAAGLSCGLMLLTKPEIAAAAAVTFALGLLLLVLGRKKPALSHLLLAGALVIAPGAAFLVLLSAHMESAEALRALAAPFGASVDGSTWSQRFYLLSSGLLQPWHNLARLAASFTILASGVVLLELTERRLAPPLRQFAGVGLLAIGAVLLVAFLDRMPLHEIGRPLPLVALAGAAVFVRGAVRRRDGGDEEQARQLGLASWSVFSFLLLGRILLNSRLGHYGFYQAMPAALLAVALLLCHIPRYLRARSNSGTYVRAAGLLLIAAVVADSIGTSVLLYRARDVPVGYGDDRMYVFDADLDPRTRTVTATLAHLRSETPDTADLLVIPEGATINYWLRRPSPSRFVNLMPVELTIFGSAVIEELRASSPNLIVLAEKINMSEYGYDGFGATDSPGEPVVNWLREDYCTAFRSESLAASGLKHTIEVLVPRKEPQCP